MSACIRCGIGRVDRGERLCAECRELGTSRAAAAAPQPSEEWTATVEGRLSALEDNVAVLHVQFAALADRTAELLAALAAGKPA